MAVVAAVATAETTNKTRASKRAESRPKQYLALLGPQVCLLFSTTDFFILILDFCTYHNDSNHSAALQQQKQQWQQQ